MKATLSHKLIIALLALTLVVLIATLGLARWSFERGFLDYVNALEQVRLEKMGDELIVHYMQANNSWQDLTPRDFSSLMRATPPAGSGPRPDTGPRGSGPGPRGRRPPPNARPGLPPTALYEVDGAYVAGARLSSGSGDTIRVPLYLGETIVGELRSEPRRQLSSPQATTFLKQQQRASWMIGAFSLALALLVSVLLAKGLLSPVRRMKADVERLSNGDYAVRLNDQRTDELGDLSRDIDRLAHTLEESRSSRKRWFADISHELRTPVTVLSGELEALRDGVRRFDDEQVASLSQEVERLRFLVDDLYELSLSDIGGLRYDFNETDLYQLLMKNVETTTARATANNIDVQLDLSKLYVRADAQRLTQLFQNLVENSLAYTDSPGHIKIRAYQRGKMAAVEIEDSAPGVNSVECEQLFQPLFRLEESRNRRYGGAGLGLAICRNIAQAHGGSITASPSVDGGLLIRVEIPMSNEGI